MADIQESSQMDVAHSPYQQAIQDWKQRFPGSEESTTKKRTLQEIFYQIGKNTPADIRIGSWKSTELRAFRINNRDLCFNPERLGLVVANPTETDYLVSFELMDAINASYIMGIANARKNVDWSTFLGHKAYYTILKEIQRCNPMHRAKRITGTLGEIALLTSLGYTYEEGDTQEWFNEDIENIMVSMNLCGRNDPAMNEKIERAKSIKGSRKILRSKPPEQARVEQDQDKYREFLTYPETLPYCGKLKEISLFNKNFTQVDTLCNMLT